LSNSSYRVVLRVAGVDLTGNLKVGYALSRIRGVGIAYSNAILHSLGIDPNIPLGLLPEETIMELESALRAPEKHSIPGWLYNRQKDPFTGTTSHAVGPELLINVRKDVEGMIKSRSWKGVRHAAGLKVRGQKTKTTGRLGQAVGVKRKAIVAGGPAAGAAAPGGTAAAGSTPTAQASPSKSEEK
jgi:small subunit ribosomal protein S13